jgi:hypothetical protein
MGAVGGLVYLYRGDIGLDLEPPDELSAEPFAVEVEIALDVGGAHVEVPDGPCVLLHDPSGNEVALLHRTRPDAMTSSYSDPDNERAVREG